MFLAIGSERWCAVAAPAPSPGPKDWRSGVLLVWRGWLWVHLFPSFAPNWAGLPTHRSPALQGALWRRAAGLRQPAATPVPGAAVSIDSAKVARKRERRWRRWCATAQDEEEKCATAQRTLIFKIFIVCLCCICLPYLIYCMFACYIVCIILLNFCL